MFPNLLEFLGLVVHCSVFHLQVGSTSQKESSELSLRPLVETQGFVPSSGLHADREILSLEKS